MTNHNNHRIANITSENNFLKWVGFCIAIGVALVIAITKFNVPVSTVITGVVFLACPLLHIFMMKNGNHKH